MSSEVPAVPLEPGERPKPLPGEAEFDPPDPLGNFTFSHPVLSGAADRWRQGGGSARLLAMLKDGSNLQAFQVLVRTTVAMVCVPLLVMVVMHYVVLDQLASFRSAADKVVWTGVAGIAATQLVVVAFLIHAFRDEPPDEDAATKKDS